MELLCAVVVDHDLAALHYLLCRRPHDRAKVTRLHPGHDAIYVRHALDSCFLDLLRVDENVFVLRFADGSTPGSIGFEYVDIVVEH